MADVKKMATRDGYGNGLVALGLSPFLWRRALVSLGLSGKFLALTGSHPVCEPAYPT